MEKGITIKTEELLYFLFFGLLFFAKGIGLYDGQPLFKVFLIAAVLCLGAKLCIGSYSIKEYLWIAGILLLGAGCYFTSGDKGLLLYAFMMTGMKNVDLNRCYKIALAVWGTAFAGLWMVSLTHMSETAYRVADKLGMRHIFRWSMGYAHPNVLHITYLILAVLVLLVIGERIHWKHYLALILGNLFVFLYSVSYTGVMICFVLIIGRRYLQRKEQKQSAWNIPEKGIVLMSFPFFILLSIISPVFLKGKLFDLLDKALNTRLSLAQHYLKPAYLSLFGSRLSEITTEHWTMDNAYVFALVAYGVLPFILLCIAFFWMIFQLLKAGRNIEVLCVLVLLAAGLTEPFLFNTSFKNISFLIMGNLLFQSIASKTGRSVSLCAARNREHHLFLDKKAQKCYDKKQIVMKYKRILIAGMIVSGVLAGFFYQTVIPKKEGYVARRSNCEDISEEITLFEENHPDYAGFYYMDDFEPGDEIEYFSGDIVWMENVRGSVMSMLLGGLTGGFFILIMIYLKKDLQHDT